MSPGPQMGMGKGIILVLISCYKMFKLLVLATKEASEHFPFGSFFHFPYIVFLLHFTSAKIMCPSHDELMQYLSARIDFEFLLLPSCLLEKLNQFSFDSCNFYLSKNPLWSNQNLMISLIRFNQVFHLKSWWWC